MPQGTNLSILFPILGAMLVAAGAFLLKRGLWPRRVGQTAHCRKCDYILVGEPPRCPECGSWIYSWNLIRGERHRRPGMALLGVALAFFGLAMLIVFTTGLTREIDWNRHKPLAWLLHDLRGGNASLATPAWNEIQRRLDAHLLSETDQARIVDPALQAQGAALPPAIDPSMSAYLTGRFLDGKLSPAQADRFFAGRMTLKLSVRPLVGSASRVPYWIVGAGPGLTGWWHRTTILEAQVDGGPIETLGSGSGGSFGGGWSTGSTLSPVRTPGLHHLRVRIETAVDVDRGTGVSWNPNAGARRTTQDLFADFQVVAGQTQIATVTRPDAAVLRPLLKIRFNPTYSNAGGCDAMIDADALPVDVAFQVFLRFNGREYPAGGVNFHKGMRSGYGMLVSDLPADRPARADVIFRSSEAVARDTVDITQIWKGQIVTPNVPLPSRTTTRPSNPTAGTTPPAK